MTAKSRTPAPSRLTGTDLWAICGAVAVLGGIVGLVLSVAQIVDLVERQQQGLVKTVDYSLLALAIIVPTIALVRKKQFLSIFYVMTLVTTSIVGSALIFGYYGATVNGPMGHDLGGKPVSTWPGLLSRKFGPGVG